jgi:hypothetical protein
MMQWHSAGATGLVHKAFETRHIIQLLDPGHGFVLPEKSKTADKN